IISSFTIQAEVNKLDIIAKMHCIYLCAKKHLAIEVFLDLMELTNLQIQNKTELVYNKSPITVSPPIFGPKRVISNIASELLLNNQNILAEVQRSQLWRLIELDETNAEVITNNLKNFFIAKMLNTQNLMHFGSDGTSVMIATRLKEINPFITNCHCIAYRLNLVGKDSAEKDLYFKNYEIIFSIKDALYNEAFNNSCTKTRQWAKALYNNIDSEFILATKYFADILLIIKYINDTLEYDKLPLIFKEFVLAFIKNLCCRFPDIGIYNAIQIFDFSQIPVNTQEMVTKVNRIELLKEWREAKLVLKNYKELDFVEG
ncbi:10215_t:CDS:2, partial [Gigaspora margarita]